MRGKRSKQYRKLMHAYSLAFNFREPYQVLLDAAIIQDTHRFKMDLPHLLERTLHGQVKPMITQCSIRHLYLATTENKADKSAWIEMAKTFERRRCGHQELEEPLGTRECFADVVDSKGSGTNRHRYIVASQDGEVRAKMRAVAGVPLVYVQRSVMVMEPMAAKSEQVKTGLEDEKIRSGVKRGKGGPDGGIKRKREDDEEAPADENEEKQEVVAKKPRKKGPKAPNPLSVKKAKKQVAQTGEQNVRRPSKEVMPDRIERQIRAAKQQEEARKDGVEEATSARKKRKKDKAEVVA